MIESGNEEIRHGGAIVPTNTGGLIGREVELVGLRGLVGEVAAGRGRSVWIQGEPGIGKTALLAAGLDGVESSGCQLFVARADETAPMFPLRVLLEALRVGPGATDPARAEIANRLWGTGGTGLATPGDPVAAAAELLLILVDRLCAEGPVVLVVDDLQWADQTSLAVWGRLARVVGQLPLLLVAAVRPVPRRDDMDRLRRGLAGTDPVDMTLAPLDPEQVLLLVHGLVSVPPGPGLRGLAGQAAGNPLYVRELVDALARDRRIEVRAGLADITAEATDAPLSLAAAISARLNFLSEPATRVLRMAALLGSEFQVEHLSVLAAQPATSLSEVIDEALAAGVLVESGPQLAFRHGLIQQALYESMPAAPRVDLHKQAARSLAASGAGVESVATQLLAAPEAADDWTVDWLAGGAPALITRAPQVAVDLLQRVRHRTNPDDERRVRLDVHLIDAQARLGRYAEVEALARPLLATTRDPELSGRVTWALAYALRFLAQYEQALTVTAQAMAEPVANARWQARLRALHASMLASNVRYDEAQSVAEQAEAEGQRVGDRVAVAWALFAASQVQTFHHVDLPADRRLVERAAAILGDDPEGTDLRLLLLTNRATGMWNLGHPTEAIRQAGQALALAERAGTPQRLSSLRRVVAELSFLGGRWDDAVAELDAIFDSPDSPWKVVQLVSRGLAAQIAVHRDDQAAVETHLGAADIAGGLPGKNIIPYDRLFVARALAAERAGQPDRALAILLDLHDPESTLTFSRITDCIWMIDTVRLALAVGNRGVAEAAARACSAEANRHSLPDALASADHCKGLVDADPIRLRAAADAFDRLGFVHFRARALDDTAVVLARRGDQDTARAAYADAARIYSDLDATWDLRRADAAMRQLGIRGIRSARRHTTGWEALTPTEVKIAELVAAGKSNPDIAGDMYLSRRTVESHVSHILTKLTCRSRVDITRQAMARR